MQQTFKKIADADWFHHFVTGVILLAGIIVGIETDKEIREQYHGVLHAIDVAILAIFTLEIVVKVGAEGGKPWRYFRDPWNCFDFIIVAVCYLPFDGGAVTVLRLLRLLRVLKLIKALPKLQVLVSALLKSLPSMAYVGALLSLLFYVYAVAGVFLFGENDPIHFGSIQSAMVTLFAVVTLEGWVDIMYINMFGCDHYGYDPGSVLPCPFTPESPSAMIPLVAVAYFISFVLMGTMIVLNLFIGVIMGGMEEAQEEADHIRKLAERSSRGDRILFQDEISRLRDDLLKMHDHLKTLERIAARKLPDPFEAHEDDKVPAEAK
jgi:voltage-gated sodium channel